MKPQMHYIVPGRDKQPIELMHMGLTDAEFEGYCIGNIMKYILRYKYKGGEKDLYKAREYIDVLIRYYNPEPILGDEEEDEEEVDGLTQNQVDHNWFPTRTYKE